METIKPDGSVTASIAYVLDDMETPVTLKASDAIAGDYGEQLFEVK